jgi:hypothetical protein
VRLDARIHNRQTAFIRYSHEGSNAFGPSPSTGRRMKKRPLVSAASP